MHNTIWRRILNVLYLGSYIALLLFNIYAIITSYSNGSNPFDSSGIYALIVFNAIFIIPIEAIRFIIFYIFAIKPNPPIGLILYFRK
jgi:hypothetical protein